MGVSTSERTIEIIHLKAYSKCLININFTLHAKYLIASINVCVSHLTSPLWEVGMLSPLDH